MNDKNQLAEAAKVMRRRILSGHMTAGVTIIEPDATYIDDMVEIGGNTVIYPGNFLEGNTVIGEGLYPVSGIVYERL